MNQIAKHKMPIKNAIPEIISIALVIVIVVFAGGGLLSWMSPKTLEPKEIQDYLASVDVPIRKCVTAHARSHLSAASHSNRYEPITISDLVSFKQQCARAALIERQKHAVQDE